MISLDQVLLLEQKVESAVAKIAQLQAENDALRTRCSELTNALSSKSEQLSSFESDQNKIESGILKALDKLNSIENSVLKAGGQAVSSSVAEQNVVPPQNIQNSVQQNKQVEQPQTNQNKTVQQQTAEQKPEIQQQQEQTESAQSQQNTQPSFFDLSQSSEQPEQTEQNEQQNQSEDGQFDIF